MAASPVAQFGELVQELRSFRDARDWKQFHNPKDLALALATEAGELLEHFVWMSPEEAREHVHLRRGEVTAEAADILAFLIYFCEDSDIDLLAALSEKLATNETRYPVTEVRGRHMKFSEMCRTQRSGRRED